tara:strand:+ start:163 stop:486 length:324 start_codon:yes stop_codon:yes gene_type:complete
MKTLKFREKLSEKILSGEKTSTWRLFDDKNLQQDEIVSFLVWETKEEFAKAKLVDVKETNLGELTEEDWEGHEKFNSEEQMYQTYSKYYLQEVTKDTIVKIIKFKLI